MIERHEEQHWHGSTFPAPGKLFESLAMMMCTCLMFTFECLLGRKQSSCSSVGNLCQDSHMLSSSQWTDSEGCGRISVFYWLQRSTVTCSQTSQTSSAWLRSICLLCPPWTLPEDLLDHSEAPDFTVGQADEQQSLTETPSHTGQDRKNWITKGWDNIDTFFGCWETPHLRYYRARHRSP